MNDFATWWTGLSRGQQDAAFLGSMFVLVLLATRWGLYDSDMRTRAEGRPMLVSRGGRALLLWGIPTAVTLFLAWGMWVG